MVQVLDSKCHHGDSVRLSELDLFVLDLPMETITPAAVAISENVPSDLESHSITPHPVESPRPTDHHISFLLDYSLYRVSVLDEPIHLFIP